ncbi:MAG: hypothetical protein WBB32_16215 [Flavobacteriales bacterium]|nr:hypothetical protein [Flavobacteriales bacterium]
MDLAYLGRLCKGDRSRMAEYIALYLQEAPRLFAQLGALANKQDAEQLAQTAHGLQPHVHYMGDERLYILLDHIQECASAQGTAACKESVRECIALNQELMHALIQWSTTDPPTTNR